MDIIRGDTDFQARVGQALALRFADQEPSPHLEKRIYDGFPSRNDQALMEQFHRVEWTERAAIAAKIDDPRLSEFANRLIYFENPQLLSAEKSAELRTWLVERTMTENEDVPWMTVPKAMRETDDMLADATGDEAELLSEIKDFLCEFDNYFVSN